MTRLGDVPAGRLIAWSPPGTQAWIHATTTANRDHRAGQWCTLVRPWPDGACTPQWWPDNSDVTVLAQAPISRDDRERAAERRRAQGQAATPSARRAAAQAAVAAPATNPRTCPTCGARGVPLTVTGKRRQHTPTFPGLGAGLAICPDPDGA